MLDTFPCSTIGQSRLKVLHPSGGFSLAASCLLEAQPAPIRPSPTPIANTMPPPTMTCTMVLASHEAVTNEGDCEELTYNHRISQLERDTQIRNQEWEGMEHAA
jgi:hypothetical protein